MPDDLSVFILGGGMLITLLAAIIQGTVGFGAALLAVPACALLDPRMSPVPQLILASLLTVPMAWRERQHLEPKGIVWIVAGRVPGAILGVLLLKMASQTVLDLSLAGFVLGAVALLAGGAHIKRTRVTEFVAGTISGIGSMVSSIGGPPVALLYRDGSGGALRANLATIFAIGLVLTYIARIASGEITLLDLKIAGIMAPGVLLGLWISGPLSKKVEGPRLKNLVLWLAGIAGIALVIKAL